MSCIAAPVLGRQSAGVPVMTAADVTAATIYWFRVYAAADFPEVTTAKDYFSLWSTDHAPDDGGIWWGDFDNLDLSDLTEQGLIWDAADTIAAGGPATASQTETPLLVRNPDDPNGRTLYLYFHEEGSNTGGTQETRMISSAGGVLHAAAWTFEGNVIPSTAVTEHTGYARVERRAAGDWHAWTLTYEGGVGAAYWTSADGIAWIAAEPRIDLAWVVTEADRRMSLDLTEIAWAGRDWWLGHSADVASTSATTVAGRITMVARPDDDLMVQPLYDLRTPDVGLGESENLRHVSALQIGTVLHVYWQSDGNIWYETMNLS